MPASGRSSAANNLKRGASGALGAVEKAFIEIADLSQEKPKENKAPKPTAGLGPAPGKNLGAFDSKMLKSFRASIGGDKAMQDTASYEGGRKVRYYVQFNPEELSFSGYGNEEMPIQDFSDKDDPKKKSPQKPEQESGDDAATHHGPVRSSHMDSAKTRIEMSVKLIFDSTDVNEAFYSDRFQLSTTSAVKGSVKTAVKAKRNIMGQDEGISVQTQIEALTAIVRDTKKRLAKFVWGDMAYEGIINNVSAEYVMFNINGEPCRATATISMVLYDANELGPNVDIWRKEFETDFGSKAGVVAAAGAMNVGL